MIKLNLKNKSGKIKASSDEVLKSILELRPDFEEIQDISESIKQNDIMVFDCKLSQEIFSLQDVEELSEEMIDKIDESYFDVFFEDVRAYIKDATDEIEEELQEKYNLDNLRCFFDIYNIDDSFTDFKFVFLISFKNIKIASLKNLSDIVGKRQLIGASKFYS